MTKRNKSQKYPLYLVSACLVGLKTRYDGCSKANSECLHILNNGVFWAPVCPEQLGGLSTPRTPADLIGGNGDDVLTGRARVITRMDEDVTAHYILGAEQVLAIAQAQQASGIFLKAGSPSCGVTPILGVTAALLINKGFDVKEF